MHVCASCKRSLPLEKFINRQKKNVQAGKDGTCGSCATARTGADPERLKLEEVAQHFYDESRGQVDGMKRKVRGSSVSLAAQKPSEEDMEESKRIYGEFAEHCELETMNLDASTERERQVLLVALATHTQLPMDQQLEAAVLSKGAALRAELAAVSAEQQRVSAMHALTFCEAQALTSPQVTDFISTLRDTAHGNRVSLQVSCYTTHTS